MVRRLLAALASLAVVVTMAGPVRADNINTPRCRAAIAAVKQAIAEGRKPARKQAAKARACLLGPITGAWETRGRRRAMRGPASSPLCDSINAMWVLKSGTRDLWRFNHKVHWCWNRKQTRITEVERYVFGWTNPIWFNLWNYDGNVGQNQTDTARESWGYAQGKFSFTVLWWNEESSALSTITVKADGGFIWHDSPFGRYQGTCAGKTRDVQCLGAG